MDDTDLAFRCVELACRYGATTDPAKLAKTYFDAVKGLETNNADKPQGPATAGKTARQKQTKNS